MEKESDKIKKKLLRFLGLGYLLLGIIIILGSFKGITGLVIADEITGRVGWLIGFVFLAIGVLVLTSANRTGSIGGLEKEN